MTKYRKYQLIYIAIDAISALLVWIVFLLFRWLVYDGKVFGVDQLMIPAFDYYQPLILYPAACIIIYYLSGYYMRPLRKRLSREFLSTLCSAAIISLGAFFFIIIDDNIDAYDYHRYLWSLGVLFLLQFTISYIPRFVFTHFTQSRTIRTFTIHDHLEMNTFLSAHAILPYDEVIIDLPAGSSDEDLYTIIKGVYPARVEIAVVPRLYDILTGAAQIDDLTASPLIRISEPKMSAPELCIKRAFDIVAAFLTLIILSPIYLLIAVAIKCSSSGPVFYAQERIGLHGRPFNILKFRTMITNSEGDTPQLSQDDDPRITKVGHFLRKYRLDELPQMINIVKGEMSFVGPRPERAYFIEQIEQQAPYYCLLYKIRPGMTSWGPIRVGYTDTMEKMIQRLNYDIAYSESMSLKLDIKILFYTFNVIIDGKGK